MPWNKMSLSLAFEKKAKACFPMLLIMDLNTYVVLDVEQKAAVVHC